MVSELLIIEWSEASRSHRDFTVVPSETGMVVVPLKGAWAISPKIADSPRARMNRAKIVSTLGRPPPSGDASFSNLAHSNLL